MDLKNQWPDHHELERRRRNLCDFQRTSLAGLALDSATSSGLGRAPRSAMQDPIQAPPGTTRQVCGLDVKRRKGKFEWQERGPKIGKDH
ncbi:hypothetical protein TNCV_51821 [Trichonephila clavipes]|nr:hypothetical protein TNCV_51821 [Trichonephila clavipes]